MTMSESVRLDSTNDVMIIMGPGPRVSTFSTEDEILERFSPLLRRTGLGRQRSNFLGMAGSQKKHPKTLPESC